MNTYLLSLKRKVSKETFSRVTVISSVSAEASVTRLVPFAVLFSRKVPLSERKVSKETFRRVTVMISDTSETFVTRLVPFALLFSRKDI